MAPPALPGDVLLEIWARLPDATSVVRCAATCKLWRRLIKDPSFLARLHRRDRRGVFHPSLFLGFFSQESPVKIPRRRRRRRRLPTLFVPAAPSRPTALPLSSFFPDAGLDFFLPVAACAGGLLALRRATANSGDAVEVCVCNPLARTFTRLPILAHFRPSSFILLDARDSSSSSSFRLLALVMNSRSFQVRAFCSRTGAWCPAMVIELPLPPVPLRSPVVLCPGTVHWLCYHSGHVFRIVAVDVDEWKVSLIVPPLLHCLRENSVCLAKSAHGRLCLLAVHGLMLAIWTYGADGIGEENGGAGAKHWFFDETINLGTQLSREDADFILGQTSGFMIEASCTESSAVLLRVEGYSLFVLNLKTKVMGKVSEVCNSNYFCPYEMDWSSCLSAMRAF